MAHNAGSVGRTTRSAAADRATPPSVDPPALTPPQLGPSETRIPSSRRPRRRDRDRIPEPLEFVEDRDYLGLAISPAQRTLLKSVYGVPLTSAEHEIWVACTGRPVYPGTPFSEVTVIAGARSGKDSRIAAPIALYEALFGEYAIARGEPTVVPLVAQDGEGSEIAFGYIRDYALQRPRLARYVDNELGRELWVQNVRAGKRLKIKCFACSAKSIRGWSIPAAVMDEVAFFRVEGGANADAKVQRAIRRGGINFARQRLVKISTPYLKGGVLWEDLVRYWGTDNPEVLVWKAPTTLMNPTVSEGRIQRERDKDPAGARVEFDADFDEDVTTFLPLELLEAAVVDGRHELGPQGGRRYMAAADPSGGGADAFTLAIVHVEWRDGRPVMVQDLMRGWRAPRGETLDLDQVVGEQAALLRRYGLFRVTGDRYAGEWPTQKYREKGVFYTQAERDKSAAFVELEPWMSTGGIELLDHPELIHEAGLLEKRLKIGGKKPTIQAPRGAHDDYPNAVALAVAELAVSLHPVAVVIGEAGVAPGPTPGLPAELWDPDRRRLLEHPFHAGRGRSRFWASAGRLR